MQTDKKEDRNPFFFRKSLMTVLLHLPEGRMCLRQPAGCHHAIMPSCRPTVLHLIIYIHLSIPRNGKYRKGANDCHCQKFQIISQIVMLG